MTTRRREAAFTAMSGVRMHRIVNDEALDVLFRAACSPELWLDRPVSDTLLRAVSELVSLAPSAGDRPVQLVFVRSAAAKARLAAALSPAGEDTVRSASVTAIVAQPRDPRPASGETRLAAASLIFAARALGLDCRPIAEFDAGAVDAAFFPDGAAAEFLCALGYGAGALPSPPMRPSAPHEACRIL